MMKSSTSPTSSTTLTLDATFFTRTLGKWLMAIAAVAGLIHWLNIFTLHLPHMRWLTFAVTFIGVPGLILFAAYFVLKLFGYAK